MYACTVVGEPTFRDGEPAPNGGVRLHASVKAVILSSQRTESRHHCIVCEVQLYIEKRLRL